MLFIHFFATGERSESDGHELELASTASEGTKQQRANSYSMSPHVHACTECGRKFPWQSSLERHMYTHTGQKPYSCRWCSLKFSIKSNCERHCLRIHGQSFNNARKEKRGQSKDQEESPTTTGSRKLFRCPVCQEAFAFKINCERHCLESHGSHYELADPEEREESTQQPKKKRRAGGPVGKTLPCVRCNAVFDSKNDLEKHEENVHSAANSGGQNGDDDASNSSSFSGSLVVDA